MANIAKLPDGFAVIANLPVGGTSAYGPHLVVERDLEDRASLYKADGTSLSLLRSDGKVKVAFDRLDPITVPYVNRFLAGTGSVVIKDWRTGDYRLKTRKGGPKVRRVSSAV